MNPGGKTMTTADARARLADIIYRRSFGRGEITLASGVKSDYYFDMKPSMLHPEGAATIAHMLLEKVAASGATHVGGLELGAEPTDVLGNGRFVLPFARRIPHVLQELLAREDLSW